MNYAPQCSTALHQLSISHWMAPRSFWVFRFQNEISTLSEKKKKSAAVLHRVGSQKTLLRTRSSVSYESRTRKVSHRLFSKNVSKE